MDDYESNHIPLLKEEFEEDLNKLENESKDVISYMINLSNEIDSNSSNTSISNTIQSKFERLQMEMIKINKHYESILSNKNSKEPKYSERIKKICLEISNNYFVLNNKIENKQKNFNEENKEIIKEKNNELKEDFPIQTQSLANKSVNANLERINLVQKEYDKIYKTSQQIKNISEDMKRIIGIDSEKIDTIDQNILLAEEANKKANIEVEKIKEKTEESTKRYIYFSIILFIICILLALVLYMSSNKK